MILVHDIVISLFTRGSFDLFCKVYGTLAIYLFLYYPHRGTLPLYLVPCSDLPSSYPYCLFPIQRDPISPIFLNNFNLVTILCSVKDLVL